MLIRILIASQLKSLFLPVIHKTMRKHFLKLATNVIYYFQ